MSSNRLSLEIIEVIDTIDRRGSFARAAEELGKVPSALSYTVQKLEEQLDVSLFCRQGRRSVLTPAGKLLLTEGRKLLASTRSLEQEVKRIATGWETRISIAVDTIQDTTPIFQVLNLFLQEQPQIEIEVHEEVLGGTWEALISDRADLVVGATGEVPNSQGIRAMPYQKLQRVLAVSTEHPLAQFWGKVSAAELARHRQVIIHDSSETEVPRSTELFSDHQHMYVDNMAQKIQAQRQGIGYGFLPYDAIKPYLATNEMKIVDVEGASSNFESLIAWKIANQGQGLKRLRELLLTPELTDSQASFTY